MEYDILTGFLLVGVKRIHVGLYGLYGKQHTPQVKDAFHPQRTDEVHGNDFYYNSFGPNAERRHWHFKGFSSVQNSAIATPAWRFFPNWKVPAILKRIKFILPLICLLGIAFLLMKQQYTFKVNIKNRDESHTRKKIMAFRPMPYTRIHRRKSCALTT